MSISGIYALTLQTTGGKFNTGGVDIEIQNYSLNSEETEVKYDNENKEVSPSEVISLISKIENYGENCYVRTKIFYINDAINFKKYVTGMSDEWEKHGDYYYYKRTLNKDEKLKIFDTIKIPDNIRELTSESKIKLEITAEAVQEKNFEPDFSKEDPWQGIVPTQSVNTKYDINTNDNYIVIKYEDGADEDINVPNNFFEEMKNLMPGDSYTSSVEIKNKNNKKAKYYFKLSLNEEDKIYQELLNNIDLIISNKNGKILYNGKMINDKKILLGEYSIGQEDKLDLKIIVPKELENKYANLGSTLNLIFSAEYEKENTENNNAENSDNTDNTVENESKKDNNKENENKMNPKTGDKISVAITIFVLSSIGLIIVSFLDYREKRNIE